MGRLGRPPPVNMTITSTCHGNMTVVTLHGRLTGAAERTRLVDWLHDAPPPTQPRIVVDLEDVTGVTRRGAEALLDAYVTTTLRRGTLALTGVGAHTRTTLDQFGVLDVIAVVAHDVVATAMATSHGRHSEGRLM